jgi:uncharacterized protein (DUF1778 family)
MGDLMTNRPGNDPDESRTVAVTFRLPTSERLMLQAVATVTGAGSLSAFIHDASVTLAVALVAEAQASSQANG